MDFLLNGQGHGDVASTLLANNCDVGALRPYIDRDGNSRITVNRRNALGHPVRDAKGGLVYNSVVTNATATLRKDDWLLLDTAVIKAAKPRLRVVADLRAAGLQMTIPNGMAKTVLQHQTQSDIAPATISMDGIREGDRDRPQFTLENLPLPIIHHDFSYSLREVMVSRNGGSPLDTTTAELAGRRVAEEIEKLALGVTGTYTYGGGSIYGLTNFPDRLTKTLTVPTSSNHQTTVNEVLAMKKQSVDNNYYGPWVLYYSPAWSAFMDEDYISTINQPWTLRSRLAMIDDITAIRQADYLTGTTLLLVQQTTDVVREVVGMEVTTLQWESKGGMELNFKVMAIQVPQVRSDYNGATGIVHGTTA